MKPRQLVYVTYISPLNITHTHTHTHMHTHTPPSGLSSGRGPGADLCCPGVPASCQSCWRCSDGGSTAAA